MRGSRLDSSGNPGASDLPDFFVPRVIGKQLSWGFVLITAA
jgi:hypothetical protein